MGQVLVSFLMAQKIQSLFDVCVCVCVYGNFVIIIQDKFMYRNTVFLPSIRYLLLANYD